MSEYGKVRVVLAGETPLLMNRLTPEDLEKTTRRRGKKYDKDKEAKKSAYISEIDGKEQLYIPAYAIYSMIIQTAGQYRSGRMSLRSLLAGTIRIEPEEIGLGHCDYQVDVRPVVVSQSRVLRARAKIPEWQAEFEVVYYKKIVTEELVQTLKTILEDAGRRIGLLDYRPQHKGWFGTFNVETFEVLA